MPSHVCHHSGTVLILFFVFFHSVQNNYGRHIRFVVMNNLLPSGITYHEKYDLKVCCCGCMRVCACKWACVYLSLPICLNVYTPVHTSAWLNSELGRTFPLSARHHARANWPFVKPDWLSRSGLLGCCCLALWVAADQWKRNIHRTILDLNSVILQIFGLVKISMFLVSTLFTGVKTCSGTRNKVNNMYTEICLNTALFARNTEKEEKRPYVCVVFFSMLCIHWEIMVAPLGRILRR